VEADQGDLGGAGQEQVVGRERVGLLPVGGELTMTGTEITVEPVETRWSSA
jgi:hypothetical protein